MDSLNLDLLAASPLITLVAISIFVLLLDLFQLLSFRLFWVLMPLAVSFGASLTYLGMDEIALSGLLYADPFSFIFFAIILMSTTVYFLLSHGKDEAQGIKPSFDVDFLILIATAGAMVMVSAANLIVLFLGFETLSVSVYVLSALARGEKTSSESGLKYFILGAFSSAFLLYGIALVFGATGTVNIAEIAAQTSFDNGMLTMGIGLLVFGFGFKVSLAPFHFWTPDVYQGAPTSITAYMASVVKVAAFGCFLRIFAVSFAELSQVWVGLLWVVAVISMTIGNIAALRQQSIKRMLAYSSIAHAGYALMGFLVLGDKGGVEATIFYLIVYSLMTLGAFGVVLIATAGTKEQYERDDIDSLSGVGWSSPFLGLTMLVFMLSLAGMPPLAGFISKFYLFSAAIQGGFVGLAIIAAINSVVSLYYYLRVVVVMFFREDRKTEIDLSKSLTLAPKIALSFTTVCLIYLGLFSKDLYSLVKFIAFNLG